MFNLKIAVPLALAVSALFASCQADIFVSVDESEQVTIVTSIGISDDLADFAGVSLDDLFGEGMEGLELEMDGDVEGADDGDGVLGFLEGIGGNDVEPYEDGEYSGYRITQTLPASDIESNLSEVEGIAAFADLVPGFEFRRTDADDGWIVSADAPLGSLLDDFTEDAGLDGIGGFLSFAAGGIDATVRIQLPGEIVESTAHRTVDGIEVWDLLDSDDVTIRVVSSEATPFEFLPWLVAGIFAVVVIAIIVWQVSSRRRPSEPTGQFEPSQADAPLSIDSRSDRSDSDDAQETAEPSDHDEGRGATT